MGMVRLRIFTKKIQLKNGTNVINTVNKLHIFKVLTRMSIVLKKDVKIQYCPASLGRQGISDLVGFLQQ